MLYVMRGIPTYFPCHRCRVTKEHISLSTNFASWNEQDTVYLISSLIIGDLLALDPFNNFLCFCLLLFYLPFQSFLSIRALSSILAFDLNHYSTFHSEYQSSKNN